MSKCSFRKYERMGPNASGRWSSRPLSSRSRLNPFPFIRNRGSVRTLPTDRAGVSSCPHHRARLPMYQHSRTFRLPGQEGCDGMRVSISTSRCSSPGIEAATGSLSPPKRLHQGPANLTKRSAGVISVFHAWPEADVNLLIEPDYLILFRFSRIQSPSLRSEEMIAGRWPPGQNR